MISEYFDSDEKYDPSIVACGRYTSCCCFFFCIEAVPWTYNGRPLSPIHNNINNLTSCYTPAAAASASWDAAVADGDGWVAESAADSDAAGLPSVSRVLIILFQILQSWIQDKFIFVFWTWK